MKRNKSLATQALSIAMQTDDSYYYVRTLTTF